MAQTLNTPGKHKDLSPQPLLAAAGITNESISIGGSAEPKTITFSGSSNLFSQVSGENQASFPLLCVESDRGYK